MARKRKDQIIAQQGMASILAQMDPAIVKGLYPAGGVDEIKIRGLQQTNLSGGEGATLSHRGKVVAEIMSTKTGVRVVPVDKK